MSANFLTTTAFAAAFVANATTAGSLVTSLAIAGGNTLEATVGAALVTRFANGLKVFDRPPHIFRFVLFGGVLPPVISATIGSTTLVVAGFASLPDFGSIWLTWWLGDMAGALLVTPLFLVWTRPSPVVWDRAQALEAVLLFMTLVASGLFVFGGVYSPARNAPLAFFCIPSLVWAAFRFGQRETALAILTLATTNASDSSRCSE